jgi:hypothetical protein
VFSARVPLLLAAVSAWGPAARQAAAAARGPTPLAASRAMGVARQNHGDVLDLVRAAHVVCFDVDSTLLTVEGIDELADVAGVHDQVQNLTSGGSVLRVLRLRALVRCDGPALPLCTQLRCHQ